MISVVSFGIYFSRAIATDLMDAGFSVFLDDWSINIGERIFEKISTGLCESKALIMIISKDYLKSVCCTDEWGAFYGKALHDKSCVIYPIIIDDSAPPALISQIKYLRFNDDEYTSALSTLLRSLRKQFSKCTSYLEDLSMLSLVYIPHYTLDFAGIMGYNST